MKRKIFMVVYDIDVNKGGINSVMFSRTHLFDNNIYTSTIVTLDDKLNYPEIEETLKEEGRIAQSASVMNVYDFYRNKFTSGGINPDSITLYEQNSQREEEGFHYFFEKNSARYFQNGRYVKYKRWSDDGVLQVVDYFSDMRVRQSREEYHPDGYLLRRMTYHPANNKINQEHYFTKEGFCYLSRWINHTTGKQQRIVLFSPDKQKAKVFTNNLDFHSYFLDELCALEEMKPIMICDGPGSSPKVQHMSPQSALRIYAIHTNHLEAPNTLKSDLKSNERKVLMNEDRTAPIVVLTNKQKIDIEAQFPEMDWNLHVISHAINAKKVDVKKKNNLVVVVTRLSKEKRIDLLIESFAKVVEEVPDALLHIYGDGDQKADLVALVKKLKVSKNIRFMGYTTKPKEKLAESLFTVITSLYEGQSLTTLEAFSVKTAVLSFRINYLMREMYQNEELGGLVENNNMDKLTEKMVDWLYDPEKVKMYGKNGYNIVKDNYSVARQYEKWHELFEQQIALDELKQ